MSIILTELVSIIVYVVTTIFTYVLGILSKKFKWNEELPIPVQNIMIGITAFAIAVFTKRQACA